MDTTTADPVSARINPPKNDTPDLHRAVAGFCLHQDHVSSSAFHSTLAILWLRRGARKCTYALGRFRWQAVTAINCKPLHLPTLNGAAAAGKMPVEGGRGYTKTFGHLIDGDRGVPKHRFSGGEILP
jgi:hypothetical protein